MYFLADSLFAASEGVKERGAGRNTISAWFTWWPEYGGIPSFST